MANPPYISVPAAAEQLGLSEDAVRKRIAAGSLSAQRQGRQWWIEARAVDRLARIPGRPGRPLSPGSAWAILLLASGDEEGAARAVDNPRYWARAKAWLGNHSLVDHCGQLKARGLPEEFDAHPSELPRILERSDVLASGVSAADSIGLVGGGPSVEAYAAAGRREAIVVEHVLQPGHGPVLMRWVPDSIWPVLDRDRDRRAPRAAVLLDLLENDDPRARREAARALAE